MNAPGCREYHRYNRRAFLKVGGATFFGLTVPQLLQARAAAPAKPVKAKQVLLLWMYGGPSQIDMFDLKPDAKKDICRPLFKPIQTRNPALQVSELMPRMARIADKYTVLRSMWPGALHWQHSALGYLLTGNPRTPRRLRKERTPRRADSAPGPLPMSSVCYSIGRRRTGRSCMLPKACVK